MINEDVVVYARTEYITKDTDGNLVIGLSKRTAIDSMLKLLKEFEGHEVVIIIKPHNSIILSDVYDY